MTGLPVHGGNLAAVARRYGVDAAALTDFSANINPSGPAPGIARVLTRIANEPQVLAPYPDPSAAPMRELVAAMHGVDPAQAVVANGGAALIDAALRIRPASRALLPVPAFSEYARALDAAGITRVPLVLGDDFALDARSVDAAVAQHHPSVVILTNPHNPSGHLIARDEMCAIVEACCARDAIVLADEAFIDYEPEQSILRAGCTFENLIVLRSLTKFYGMAGVRIGYALASAALASEMRRALPSWPAGAIEQAIAAEVLTADPEFEEESRRQNAAARTSFAAHLAAAGLRVAPSAANFLLVELPARGSALDSLLERLVREYGLIVRDCRDYEGLQARGYVRVAVRRPHENERLVFALRELLGLAREDSQSAVP